jgi:hypothetical protein
MNDYTEPSFWAGAYKAGTICRDHRGEMLLYLAATYAHKETWGPRQKVWAKQLKTGNSERMKVGILFSVYRNFLLGAYGLDVLDHRWRA